ncbi:MAG: phage tail protein, partial [Bermanella sp.]
AVPRATAQAINRVTKRVVTLVVRDVAKEVKVPQKLIRQRLKHVKALYRRPVGYIHAARSRIPAIALGVARTQIRRQRGQFLVSQAGRNKQGRFTQRQHAGNTSIRVGRHVFPNAFLQKLKNGKWHIMHRSTDARYPIDVAAIPIAEPITRAVNKHANTVLQKHLPKELEAALKQQLRLVIKRAK